MDEPVHAEKFVKIEQVYAAEYWEARKSLKAEKI